MPRSRTYLYTFRRRAPGRTAIPTGAHRPERERSLSLRAQLRRRFLTASVYARYEGNPGSLGRQNQITEFSLPAPALLGFDEYIDGYCDHDAGRPGHAQACVDKHLCAAHRQPAKTDKKYSKRSRESDARALESRSNGTPSTDSIFHIQSFLRIAPVPARLRREPPVAHHRTRPRACRNILSLYGDRVPYNICRNLEWQVCAALNRIPGQGGTDIIAYTPP